MWCAWSDTFCHQRGGGQVFKTLHWLVQSLKSGRNSLGAVVIEDDSCASRHLRQCVLEHRLKILVHNLSFNLLGAISFRIFILQFFVSGMKLFFFAACKLGYQLLAFRKGCRSKHLSMTLLGAFKTFD